MHHLATIHECHAMLICTMFQKKPSPVMFDNNFGKCEPIFKILSPGDS